MPRLYVSPTMQPNAFATGRNPQHAAVAVTAGHHPDPRLPRAARRHRPRAVARLQPRHPDLQRGRRARPASSRCWPTSRCSSRSAAGTTTTAPTRPSLLLMLILGPLAAVDHPAGDQPQPRVPGRRLRRRADQRPAGPGQRAPEDPLRHAAAAAARRRASSTSTAHLMIDNPFQGGGIASLFSTHPPMAERVRRLEQMAANSGPVQFQRYRTSRRSVRGPRSTRPRARNRCGRRLATSR